jgi:steroid delta-isomerase-like uncharacterized protein
MSSPSGQGSAPDPRDALIDEHVQSEVDHDMDRLMATWGEQPDFDDVAWNEQWHGREGIREHYEELLRAFPDMTIEVHRKHKTEDTIILEVTVRGTLLNKWRDLPATGRKLESRVCAIYTTDEQGLLNMERTYYDNLKVLTDLGLARDPRTTMGKVMAAITPPFVALRAYLKPRKPVPWQRHVPKP